MALPLIRDLKCNVEMGTSRMVKAEMTETMLMETNDLHCVFLNGSLEQLFLILTPIYLREQIEVMQFQQLLKMFEPKNLKELQRKLLRKRQNN